MRLDSSKRWSSAASITYTSPCTSAKYFSQIPRSPDCPPRSQKMSFTRPTSIRPMFRPTVGGIFSGASGSIFWNKPFICSSAVVFPA